MRRVLGATAVLAAVSVLAWACGGGGDGQAAPTGGATSAAPVTTTLAVIGKDIAFDRTTLEAPAGAVVIEFDNQDKDIPHNFHVFSGGGPAGQSVDLTRIVEGPIQQTLSLELAPGAYFYQCDVHPSQMKGTLNVR